MMKWKISIALGIVSALVMSPKAIAHGVHIQKQAVSAVQVQAVYDSGQPMDNAQVTIYAPENPATPWMQGISDDRGQFVFVPESSQSGAWTVKIRKAGHGQTISIPWGESVSGDRSTDSATSPANQTQASAPNSIPIATASLGSYNSLQKGVMIASVIWGCVGTALFFSRSKPNAHS